MQRAESYKIVNEEVTEWQPVIKKNREAAQIDFREDPNWHIRNHESKMQSKEFKSIGVIKDINQNLDQAKLLNANQIDNTIEETIKNQELSKETIGALDKHRHLLLYREIKAKRLKKIKSKLYRRIKKKQREKEEAQQLGMKISNDKHALYEEIEKLERQRAEERASLRHRANNKFSNLIKRYADKNAHQTLQTNLNMQRKDVINKLKELHNDFDKIDSSYDEDDVG